MEFRDFCLIFFRQWKLFSGVVLGIVAVSALLLGFQPDRFEADLTLNVTRAGSRHATEYSYDHFYRLQADERFADTVVRWLGSASFQEGIRHSAAVTDGVSGTIEAKRLSSQMISVTYVSPTREGFGDMARAIPEAVNLEAERLNGETGDPDWFIVLADVPAVRDARLPARLLLPLGAALGIFFAFWTVLIIYYFLDGSKRGH